VTPGAVTSVRPMLALATCAELHAQADEAPLGAALGAAGIAFRWAVWDDADEDWSAYDAVVIRTTWDYADDPERFRAWAGRVDSLTRLWNPAAVVAWNSHKRYLLELGAAGVAITPTLLVDGPRAARAGDGAGAGDAGTGEDLGARIAAAGWERAAAAGLVVKPAESVGSIGLSMWGPADLAGAAAAVADLRRAGHDVLVQPLLPAITAAGETSVIFVDGAVSHAVCKVPAEGDIRSQPEHGGRLRAVVPTSAQVALGADAIAAARARVDCGDEPFLYARVDCVDHDGEPVLMELELIEPDLFVGFDAAAAPRLVAAVRDRLRR
jgi:hypothetical protein